MGNNISSTPNDKRIGHVVRFPQFEWYPVANKKGCWVITTESINEKGYVLMRVKDCPPIYKEEEGFLYMVTDHYGQFIIVFNGKNEDVIKNILRNAWKSPLTITRNDLMAFSVFRKCESVIQYCEYCFPNPDYIKLDLESYRLTITFLTDHKCVKEAFDVVFRAFRLEGHHIFYGKLSYIDFSPRALRVSLLVGAATTTVELFVSKISHIATVSDIVFDKKRK